MTVVRRTVAQDLGQEIPDIQAEDLAFAERAISARGRPDPALARHMDRTKRGQAAAEIRVFAMEFDRPIEPADAIERVRSNREVPAVEDGTGADEVMDDDVRWRRDDRVVRAKEAPAEEIPVVKPVRP